MLQNPFTSAVPSQFARARHFDTSHYTVAGLRNTSNNCFLNVILQAFAAADLVRHWRELGVEFPPREDCAHVYPHLVRLLGDVLPRLAPRKQDSCVVFPKEIFGFVDNEYPQLCTSEQQDAQEAYHVLLAHLDNEVDRLLQRLRLGAVARTPDLALGCGAGLAKLRRGEFEVARLREGSRVRYQHEPQARATHPFKGFTQRCKTCLGCGFETATAPQMFIDLSLALPYRCMGDTNAYTSLGECLRDEHEDVIEGVRCDHCHKAATARFVTRFAVLPRVMCVHLKRLVGSNIKLRNHVAFSDRMAFGQRQYSLLCVIEHLGSARFGHYRIFRKITVPTDRQQELAADALRPDVLATFMGDHDLRFWGGDKEAAGLESLWSLAAGAFGTNPPPPPASKPSRLVWLCISDEDVQVVSFREVQESRAYLLFYERDT